MTRPRRTGRTDPRRRGRRERGQTTIDFALGASLFLLSAAFVLAFVPGMLQPFSQSAQDETVTADRIASQLAEGTLAEDGQAYVLDQTCTVAFFDDTVTESDCSLDGGGPVTSRLHLDGQRLNVTLVADTNGDGTETALCERSDGSVGEGSCSSQPFAVGDTPPADTASVVVARRTVTIDHRQAKLLARVW